VVDGHLKRLAPMPREQARSTQSAYQRFTSVQKEIPPTMMKKRSLWVFLTIAAVLIVAFSLTPVRTWASSLLGMFRVQQVAVVNFDPQAARDSRQGLANSEDIIRQVFKDNLEVIEQGKMKRLSDPDDVVQAVDFSPRTPFTTVQPKFYVKPGMQANFTIDQPTMQA
jgi:hypothetical protein